MALSFTANGAQGETFEGISKTLEGSVKDIDELNKKCKSFIAYVAKENQCNNKLSTANVIFHKLP